MDELKQTAKGENISQTTLIVQGDYNVGINREEVIGLIESYCPNREEVNEIIDIVHKIINDIPSESWQKPNKRIFVPAIQQLSYSLDDEILKAAYKNLLASSMDAEKSSTIHPSFIEVLSQLSPDEVKIINSLPRTPLSYHPLINLRMKIGNMDGLGYIQVKYFSDIGYDVCEHPENICFYLENLERLKLIDIPQTIHLNDEKVYTPLKEHPAILAVMEKNKSTETLKITYEFDEKCFCLTQYGINFIQSCTYNSI